MSSNIRNLRPPDDMSDAPYMCANHPNVPTYLRCARCEKPICAKCRVATPVGYRCFDCAQLTVLPTYAVSNEFYTRAALSAFGLATVVGIVWAFLPGFEFWAALVMGLGVGEVVGRAANQKRGPGLQAVAVAATLWGIVVSRLVLAFLLTMPSMTTLISDIPGNASRVLIAGVTADRSNLFSLFLTLLSAPFTGSSGPDIAGILFLLMALVLSYIRLR